MPALVWDDNGKRFFETGVSKGVLYKRTDLGAYGNGVAWNGLSAITESPDGAEANDVYADNIKYLSLRSTENFKGTIEAYTYPDEWEECDGSKEAAEGVTVTQQKRSSFGLAYQTKIGNDVNSDDLGYKIHLIWNATASPTEKGYQTVNDSPEAITFSWEFDTVPTAIGTGFKPSAHMEIDSTKVDATKLAAFLTTLYGDADTEPTLPTPAAVITAFTTV